MPPKAPKSWVERGIDKAKGKIDEAKDSGLAVLALGALAVSAALTGIAGGLATAANNFNESHRETTCQKFEVKIQSEFVDGMIYTGLDSNSEAAIQNFFNTQPGGHQSDQFAAKYTPHNIDTVGKQDIQVCVTDAPFSGSEVLVSPVESADDKQASTI